MYANQQWELANEKHHIFFANILQLTHSVILQASHAEMAVIVLVQEYVKISVAVPATTTNAPVCLASLDVIARVSIAITSLF